MAVNTSSAAAVVAFLLLAVFLLADTADDGNDTSALRLFLNQTDIYGALVSNWTTASAAGACTGNWRGVRCTNNRVTAVSAPSLNLRGPIDALAALDQLRSLDLSGNRLVGSLSPISRCSNLETVDLSENEFSGNVPLELSALSHLQSLDLSNNNLRGSIPAEFVNLSDLRVLQLQNNQLSGTIPSFFLDSIPHLLKLNLSDNEFGGFLSQNFTSKFGFSSFSGNQNLILCSSTSLSCSSSSPNSNTSIPNPTNSHPNPSNAGIISILSAISFLFLASIALTFFCCCRRCNQTLTSMEATDSTSSSEKIVHADPENVTTTNDIVFLDRRMRFSVNDLLQSTAEVIGKGTVGTVYRAILDSGFDVAVKRLKDTNQCNRAEFVQSMEVIGNLRHSNLVKLIGYYFSSNEKLLVYEYMPNGSLHSLLHDSSRLGRLALDWTTRIGIMLGAARGLAKIHASSGAPHGNVKSSNVLLDRNGVACMSDFGLSYITTPPQILSKLGGYRAPEQSRTRRFSRMADVYSFGIVLLEMLTGKSPAAVDLPGSIRAAAGGQWLDPALMRYKSMEGEMVAMLQVATACVASSPANRPEMSDVVRMIEDIRNDDSLGATDYAPAA